MTRLVIVGGGPSGLAAAYEASKHGASAVVVEKLDRVGGLARTLDRGGNRYDIGPHRFFTTNAEVRELFLDILGEDVVVVRRLTRILHGGRYFDYPLTPLNALLGLGIWNTAATLSSYAAARLRRQFRRPRIETFEDWIVDRFGQRLYRTFFKTYTEKIWGIPCDRIGAEWASQRIKGLSLSAAVRNALFAPKARIKTLVDEFMYPRLGAGQLYEKMARDAARRGAEVLLGSEAVAIRRRDDRVTGIVARTGSVERVIDGDHYLCSAPLTEMLAMMDPPPPPDVLAASCSLRYRNHIGVKLDVLGVPFPDNWIYVHSPEVRAARIASYRNFSAAMAKHDGASPLTVEYFCFPGDGLWEMTDDELVALATAELARLGMLAGSRVVGGFAVRSERAYPVIELGYERHIARIRRWLSTFANLMPIGRSGMFKYNNQDHAIATGLLAARTALGLGRFDPWNVNIDGEYHEAAEVVTTVIGRS
jgi:protoporphyrinogen oxidase